MSHSDANCDEIITDWIIEYARSLMWQKFKACNSDPLQGDEFIRAVITKAQLSGCCSEESLLTEWMFLVHYGCNLCGNRLDNITPLEKAVKILPHMKQNFRSSKQKEFTQVEQLLKEQAVLVCIKERDFDLAKKVKDRIWKDTTTEVEQKICSRLDLIIQSRSLSGYDTPSFEDLRKSARKLLEDLCEKQLPCPYLIKRAVEEGRKKVAEQDQMTRNLAAATQTGIMMTGSLLSAFISKHKLQPEVGVGFVSQDQFESAVQSLRQRKDQLLKNIPDFSTPFAQETENASPAPVTIEKAVSSSSLKRKSRERCSSSHQFRKRSSASDDEHHQKDSTSGSDVASDDEKAYDISLRKRIARSHKEPLFEDVKRLQFPRKQSNPQVKRKPRLKWTEDEEKKVYKAVQKYGVSRWADIVDANILPGRSNVDIKDKWRTLVKTGRDKELKKELMFQDHDSSVDDY